MIRVAIIGARGYTGVEAIEILLRHSEAEVTYLTAQVDEPEHITETFGQLRGRLDMMVEPLDLEKLSEKADVALCCLPHKVSMQFVPKLLDAGLKVVDLSADYRIKNVDVYEKYYQPHTDQENLDHAVYGLPELFRDQIKGAELVANPGCFPTGSTLSIAPLLKAGLIDPTDIIINSVSGVSGAGKTPSPAFHFPNMNENLFAYGIGVHRHTPEIQQLTSVISGKETNILFQPHVGCFDRGIHSSVYCKPTGKVTQESLLKLYNDFYADETFVSVLSSPPKMKDVAKTNHCQVFPTLSGNRIVCFSAIDNLIKGASGQAIQNMNIMFGLDETLGLK
jgi:N-acetyl-gamma-glutamyl-phosphate reductase